MPSIGIKRFLEVIGKKGGPSGRPSFFFFESPMIFVMRFFRSFRSSSIFHSNSHFTQKT